MCSGYLEAQKASRLLPQVVPLEDGHTLCAFLSPKCGQGEVQSVDPGGMSWSVSHKREASTVKHRAREGKKIRWSRPPTLHKPKEAESLHSDRAFPAAWLLPQSFQYPGERYQGQMLEHISPKS